MGKYCIYPGCNKEDIAEDGRIPSCEYHKERRIKIVGRVAKVGTVAGFAKAGGLELMKKNGQG